uniref:C2HC/C3H-type domain-containing protein n=1 Tax=Alexandrium catenella TaxID=2925 RepID=A0A7S1S1E9_ALECA
MAPMAPAALSPSSAATPPPLPAEPPSGGEGPLVPCPECGRNFNQESLERHVRVCKKVFHQKRRQFDSAANRLCEFENANELIANAKKLEREKTKGGATSSTQGVPKWKQKSLAFRQAILAAKAAGGDAEAQAKADDIQHQLDAAGGVDSDMTQCPHCGRTFNKEAGERHIAICIKTFGNKPGGGRLVKGGGRVAVAATRGLAPSPAAYQSGSATDALAATGAAARKPSAHRGRAMNMQGAPQPAAAFRGAAAAFAPRY